MPIDEKELVVVHTDEAHSLLYNPMTHEVSESETADGNVILIIRPKAVNE